MAYLAGLMIGKCFDVIAKLTGRKLPVSSVRIRKFCSSTEVDASKVDRSGFVRTYSLKDGLQRTLKHEFGGRK